MKYVEAVSTLMCKRSSIWRCRGFRSAKKYYLLETHLRHRLHVKSHRQSRSVKCALKGHKQSAEKTSAATSRILSRMDFSNKVSSTSFTASPRLSKEVPADTLEECIRGLRLIARPERQHSLIPEHVNPRSFLDSGRVIVGPSDKI